MWIVKLARKPDESPWKDDYFPRSFKYKKDALELMVAVSDNRGLAVLLKEPKITAKQEGGDDGYCYVVRVNGVVYVEGLTRAEVDYWKKQSLKRWVNEQ